MTIVVMKLPISFEPIYGNGWLAAPSGAHREVPQPFFAEPLSKTTMMAAITTTGHEFDGGLVSFSFRHSGDNECVHVEIIQYGRPVAIGYAKLKPGK